MEDEYDYTELEAEARKEKPASSTPKRKLEDDSNTQPIISKNKRKKAEKDAPEKVVKSGMGIWIGNLSYFTTEAELRDFFVNCGTITRLKMSGTKARNKGFAHVDFDTEEAVSKAMELSESFLNDRAVLIKDAYKTKAPPRLSSKNASGEPISAFKGGPNPTIFVGNLSFDTTKQELRANFAGFGKIRKIRLMTFEDTGKCKGFAFIDFFEEESAKNVFDNVASLPFIHGRKLRIEPGSAEAVRRGAPWVYDPKGLNNKAENFDEAEVEEEPQEEKEPFQPSRRERKRALKEQRAAPKQYTKPAAPGITQNRDFQGQKIKF